jgi:hypothetical protein
MNHHHPFTRRAFLAGLLAAPVLAACGGGDDGDDDGEDAAPSEESTTATTLATTTTAPPVVAPLTGLPFAGDPAFLGRPALIVKVDNADNGSNTARPQAGLNAADVVIEELVEGGVTRFAAVFHSADADTVGPIRSGRLTDLEYVALFGQPLFGWSGGNDEVNGAIGGSSALHDVGYNVASGAYYRAGGRTAPHNLMSSTPALYEAGAGFGVAPTGLLPFSGAAALTAPNWRPTTGVDIAFAGSVAASPSSFDWDPARGFARSQEGTPHVDEAGVQVVVTTVVVLFVDYTFGGNDSSGTAVPQGDLVGSGAGLVLAGGMLADVTWTHPDVSAPMSFTLADGSPLSVPPGRSWWSLPPPGSASLR